MLLFLILSISCFSENKKSQQLQNDIVKSKIIEEKIISEEVPVAVLFQRQKRYLVNPEVKDITFLSIGGEYFLRDMYMGK